jgi:glutamyl-tRNA synthetase
MVRLRIAPSPTGYPHIGTVYQALLNYAYAKKNNGTFSIRIEDTDRNRFVEDAEQKIYDAIDWFGLTEDESPRKDGPYGPYRQSQRLDIYQKYAKQLVDEGKAYYCFCTPQRLEEVRKDMQAKGLPPMYDKYCRNLKKEEIAQKLSNNEKYVIRLKVPENQTIIMNDLIRGEIKFDSNGVDDQVLLKSDGFPTYHLAVVVDDHLMEITHTVRGEEWLPSSPKHILLYQYFNWPQPIFIHTPTLRNPDKSKLSKRQGHTNVQWYIEKGFLPQAVLNFLGNLGWTHPQEKEIYDLQEYITLFDFKDLSPAGPVFNEEKLRWMNGKYIREKLSNKQLYEKIKPYITISVNEDQITKTIPLIKERIDLLSEADEHLKFLLPDQDIDIELIKKQSKKTDQEIKLLLSQLKEVIEKIQNWNLAEIEAAVRNLKGQHEDWKAREYFMTVRVATTAFPVTPPLFESIEILGRDLTVKRISSVIEKL